jgi:hypothetical protein
MTLRRENFIPWIIPVFLTFTSNSPWLALARFSLNRKEEREFQSFLG